VIRKISHRLRVANSVASAQVPIIAVLTSRLRTAAGRNPEVEMAGPPNRTDAPTDSNVPFARTFVDHEGARWRVYEQPFSDYDRRSGMSLIFASEGAVRRVRNYPPDWINLSDEDLLTLSWMA
jgi:hypothetical protein